MSQNIVRLGVVGVGGIWNTHARNLAALGDNCVVAVCDLNEENRTRAAEALGARAYADVDEMFAGEELDAAISCTPPGARAVVARAAVKHAVPLFIEKPPAATLEDGLAISRIVAQGTTPVVCGFMYRYFPVATRLKQLIEGRKVLTLQSAFLCPAATHWGLPGWFYIKERSGGHILDQAIHSIDFIRYFAGDIVEVHTYGTNVVRDKAEDFTIEDTSSTNLRFASGAVGSHVHSWVHDKMSVSLTVIGESFHLRIDLDNRISGFIDDQQIDETLPAMPEGSASHHYIEMEQFLSAVRSGDYSTLLSPYSDAVKSLAVVLAMNQSIERGAPVAVPATDT
ncbi:MAG TPA: Gfo/Idh/MocA family oxidoreductase [Abditibacteriaceae bacterium]